jgi:hypothetical protein
VEPYPNLSRVSGITHYETGADYILVKFRGDKPPYRYSYKSAGKRHVDRMKALAAAGRGLSTYISRHVHDRYEHSGQE